ncbi:acyl-CoA dehydrogenase [Micromonospora sp. NPDC049559]|uniref:acyl-CoA dehydrogenase n=1 Tax=Micromonospora sp. NPDC049559 TaxID=3155923 RepID=UPI003418A65C
MTVELEAVLGDPRDGANPVGAARILRADERGELLAAGEEALASWGLNAEFVPARLGGRLVAADRLVRAVRPVFRRDLSLGLGYGVTSLMAAVNVWSAGTPAQRRRVADLLLRGERLAVAYHEPEHGNDLARNEFAARVDGDLLRLAGSKRVVNNIARCAAFVLFARTADSAGPRAHSLLLVERDRLDPARVAFLPRTRTSGVRGVRLGGVRAADLPVPATALLGAPGRGMENALRSFQVTRAVLPGLAVGAVDTALRTVLRFAMSRRLYGGTVLDLPHARETLAGALADLLAVDALATAACRGLHLLPEQSSLHSAAAKYLGARLLTGAMEELAVVLGARYYLREGEHALFGKHLRDLPVVGLGHAGETACLLAIIPQLPALARRAWRTPAAPPPALFAGPPGPLAAPAAPPPELPTPPPDPAAPLVAPDADPAGLPELDFARLTLASAGRDDLTGLLLTATVPEDGPRHLVASLADSLRALARDAATTPPARRGPLADPETMRLAERYALLLAAAAAVGTWLAGRERGDPFLGEPRWLAATLARLYGHLAGRPAPLPAGTADWLVRTLLDRERDGLSFDLSATPVRT